MGIEQAEAPAAAATAASGSSANSVSTAGDRGGSSGAAAAAAPGALDGFKIDCLMNARYHATREAFLDTVHRWLMFLIIACGASAMATIAGEIDHSSWIQSALSVATAIFGALDLTFDLSNRARAHALMKRRHFELLADVAEDRRPLHEAQACLHRFCADEEPAYHALIATSWNAAQEMIYGNRADAYAVPIRHRLLQNLWRFDGARYQLRLRQSAAS